MSKLRQNVQIGNGDIQSPAEGDLKPFVVFTQLVKGGPFIYAGWVDAADTRMALQFAREHYGQDQKCVCIWTAPQSALGGTGRVWLESDTPGRVRAFAVFVQKRRGDPHTSVGEVEATSSAAAVEAAWKAFDNSPAGIWVIERDVIIATDEDDVIWRYTDQTYRLARGYSTSVRDKWEKIRAEKDIEDYEKDDLKETF